MTRGLRYPALWRRFLCNGPKNPQNWQLQGGIGVLKRVPLRDSSFPKPHIRVEQDSKTSFQTNHLTYTGNWNITCDRPRGLSQICLCEVVLGFSKRVLADQGGMQSRAKQAVELAKTRTKGISLSVTAQFSARRNVCIP
jgi:hypothetical protein